MIKRRSVKKKRKRQRKDINCIWNNVKDKERMDHKNYFDEKRQRKKKRK